MVEHGVAIPQEVEPESGAGVVGPEGGVGAGEAAEGRAVTLQQGEEMLIQAGQAVPCLGSQLDFTEDTADWGRSK